jgi:hypothetical protein
MTSSALPVADAYALLSRPILEITDAEALLIIAELRRRRLSFQNGEKDPSGAKKKPAASAKDKSEATASLLLNLPKL